MYFCKVQLNSLIYIYTITKPNLSVTLFAETISVCCKFMQQRYIYLPPSLAEQKILVHSANKKNTHYWIIVSHII